MTERPTLNLTDQEKRIFRESFVEAFGENGSEKRKQMAKEVASGIGAMLKQELRHHEGTVWLFTLGKPARPLSAQEIEEAKQDGREIL